MKEHYEEPVMELILLDDCDVIRTSNSDGCTTDYEDMEE